MYLEATDGVITYEGSNHVLIFKNKEVLHFGLIANTLHVKENILEVTEKVKVFVGTKEECEQEIENLKLKLEQV